MSSPKSSARAFAYAIASMELIPQFDPIKAMVSYSGPMTSVPAYLPSLTFEYFQHGTGHPKQAISRSTISSLIVAAHILSTFSKDPFWKFLVGSSPAELTLSTHIGVPYSFLIGINGCELIFFTAFLTASLNFSG